MPAPIASTDAVLPDGAEPPNAGEELEASAGQLEAEVAGDVGAEAEAKVVVHTREVVGVAGLEVEVPAQLVAVLGPGADDGDGEHNEGTAHASEGSASEVSPPERSDLGRIPA